MQRSEDARALFHRAGNAHVAVSVDTRPKTIQSRRRKNDRKSNRQNLKKGQWD